jgi:hypothetical protein
MAKKRKAKKAKAVKPPQYAAIPNQVFLGVPWKTIRRKYEGVVEGLRKKYPLSFVIVGRDTNQDAEDLLDVIKRRILTSSYAIFDATGGNANVSLEFGFAEANDVPRALYLSTHKAAKATSKEAPIIADLAGKKQNRYAQVAALEKLLRQFSQGHAYTKRFEQFLGGTFRRRSKGEKKRIRSLCLKIVHQLVTDGKARRSDVVQNLQADAAKYDRDEVDNMILRMHNAGLINSVQGPYSTVTIT